MSLCDSTDNEAILHARADLGFDTYKAEITFPTGSSTSKAGVIFAHDGSESYYAVVLGAFAQ